MRSPFSLPPGAEPEEAAGHHPAPRRRGRGSPTNASYRLDPPPRNEERAPPLASDPARGTYRRAQNGSERGRSDEDRSDPTARPRASGKGDLERSRGTGKGPTETHSRDRRGTRRTRRDGIPPRRRGRDRPRATSPHTGALASEGRLPRQGTTAPPTPRGRGRGSAVEPEDAAPLPPRHRQRAGWRSEGPAGRARRAGPFAMNVRPSSGAA